MRKQFLASNWKKSWSRMFVYWVLDVKLISTKWFLSIVLREMYNCILFFVVIVVWDSILPKFFTIHLMISQGFNTSQSTNTYLITCKEKSLLNRMVWIHTLGRFRPANVTYFLFSNTVICIPSIKRTIAIKWL